MDALFIYFSGLGLIIALMTALWLASLGLRNASIVDIFWGTGFVVASALYFALATGNPARKTLLMVLVALWGLRLSVYIGYRNWGKPEDARYQVWRHNGGARWWWLSYFQVFLLQGILMWLVSSTLLIGQTGSDAGLLTVFDLSGLVVWLFGFGFEAIGDWQLLRFKADPLNKGKVMDRGLWRYTRHPNYFGEATLWWGFFLIALNVPNGWIAALGPIIMSFLLLRVSGITLLERSLEQRPGYREYIERTSAFVPLPPRKGG